MKKPALTGNHRVIIGVELEGYTISVPDHTISRKLAFHKKGASEKGEHFKRDWSIGTEYNSRPFSTVREGLFLLKAGLRKYNRSLYRSKKKPHKTRQVLLTGGWKDRFAGTHVHISIADEKMTLEKARRIAAYIHNHIPLIIAMSVNSPVWADEITGYASARVVKGSHTYFKPTRERELSSKQFNEITLNRGRKTKPPTLEIRVMDSNLPEFIMAAVCVVKACVMAYLSGKKISHKLTHYRYLKSRTNAAYRGMKAKLCWGDRYMPAAEYLDRFVWLHRKEFKQMDIPQEVWLALKLIRKGIDGSWILREAVERAHKEHPQTWQKRFAKRYVQSMNSLLAGNTLTDFVGRLGVKTPDISDVWLGRPRLNLSS